MSHNRLSDYFKEWDTTVMSDDEQALSGSSGPGGFAPIPFQILAGLNEGQTDAMRALYERAYAEALRQSRKTPRNRLSQYFADGDGV